MPRCIGLMSGTSLDGVDAAWVETDGVAVQRFGPRLTVPYDDALRADLRALLDRAPKLDAADAGGAAAEQDDGLVAVLLQQAQDHDLHQAAHMQAVGGAVEADIGGDRAGAHGGVQRRFVRALVEEAALLGLTKEIARRDRTG